MEHPHALSEVIDDAAAVDLSRMTGPMPITPDPLTSFPAFDLGRTTTHEDVAAARDEE